MSLTPERRQELILKRECDKKVRESLYGVAMRRTTLGLTNSGVTPQKNQARSSQNGKYYCYEKDAY